MNTTNSSSDATVAVPMETTGGRSFFTLCVHVNIILYHLCTSERLKLKRRGSGSEPCGSPTSELLKPVSASVFLGTIDTPSYVVVPSWKLYYTQIHMFDFSDITQVVRWFMKHNLHTQSTKCWQVYQRRDTKSSLYLCLKTGTRSSPPAVDTGNNMSVLLSIILTYTTIYLIRTLTNLNHVIIITTGLLNIFSCFISSCITISSTPQLSFETFKCTFIQYLKPF